uniref:Uncharacterized protein n=1 Tax=Heterorhabditis bacteriophora TaxID=37862 RepID=A0A1I7WKD9_HETBA
MQFNRSSQMVYTACFYTKIYRNSYNTNLVSAGYGYSRGLVIVEWGGRWSDPGRFPFGHLSYLVIADYLLCVCAFPAEVRKRLKWGFRLFARQIAVDRTVGKFRCTWTTFSGVGLLVSFHFDYFQPGALHQRSFPTSPSRGEWDNFGRSWSVRHLGAELLQELSGHIS